MAYEARLHPLGFREAHPRPTPEALAAFYRDRYFQSGAGSYTATYSDDEKTYFRNIARVAHRVAEREATERSLLDLGCGEGWFAAAFADLGWSTTCVDYSVDAIQHHNPQLMPCFQAGSLEDGLRAQVADGRTFGLVNLQNVLEHVLDPLQLLQDLKPLMGAHSALRIKVPNDYSAFQAALVGKGCTGETWFAPPEHLSYFDAPSLARTLEHCGWRVLSLQADFPIEMFLANPHANYWADRSLGRNAHLTRVFCENFLIDQDIDAYIAYSEAAGKLGFGRDLIAYAAPR